MKYLPFFALFFLAACSPWTVWVAEEAIGVEEKVLDDVKSTSPAAPSIQKDTTPVRSDAPK